jgi:protein-tyrosine phosphatase
MSVTKVLFVCLGNICRSPMAEYVLRDLVDQKGLSQQIEIASAGTSGWHNGEDMHQGSKDILHAHNINTNDFQSSEVKPEDIAIYDHIIAMDDKNLQDLSRIFGSNRPEKVYKITDLLPDSEYDYVPDPYFSGNFNATYTIIHAGCIAWLKHWQRTA